MSSKAETPFPVFPALQSEGLLDCIHCGICLSVCPTYDLTGNEADSPRGRIYLIRALAEGRAELNEATVRHFDSCLGCLACETACPSAVGYGQLINTARDQVERHFPRSAQDRRARRLLLDMVTSPARMAPLMLGARLATSLFGEGGGPAAMVNRFLFGPKAPPLPSPPEAGLSVRPLPEFTPAVGERRARVVLLAGCVMQVLFQRVNEATIRVLAANGCDVVVPRNLGCCGAFHAHNGELEGARTRAEALLRALDGQEYDAFITNSAGCGSTLKEYGHLFHETAESGPIDPALVERAEKMVRMSRDASEFLAEIGLVPPPVAIPRRVAYHDACHLAHGQKVRSQPRELLRAIPELELVEFQNADWCCGSAGIYNFLQPEMAQQLQEKKVGYILEKQPELLVTGNPGCHAWIEAGLRGKGSPMPVRHTMELLDEAYGGAAGVRPVRHA